MFNALSVAGFGGSIANAFSPDSKVLGQSAASARETVKKLDDIASPLQQMTNFFASIDNGIVKLVDFAKRSLVNEEGQRVFKSFDHYQENEAQPYVVQAARELAQLL